MSKLPTIHSRKTLEKIQSYQPGMPIWELKKMYGLSHVIKLASNENPLGPSPKIIRAILGSLPELHRYPDANTTTLKEHLADHLKLSPEHLLVTNGGDELIKLLSETYLEPEDEIVVPSPTFREYEFGAHVMGAAIKTVPLEADYAFNVSAILAAITDRTKLVYLCSPNNPTGTYLTRQDLAVLLDQLPDGVLLVLDAAYSHYATAEDYTTGMEFVRQGYPILVLQTFSKIYALAGIRVGFGVAHPFVIQKILKVKEPFNVNSLAQTAAITALGDVEHYDKSLAENTKGRKQLYDAFDEMNISYTVSMSNFVLAKLGPNAGAIYQELLARGIILRYGDTWGLPEHIRISVGTLEENQILIENLRELLLTIGK
ncbi:histidinol-phosphate transaminase [Brevibacillus sp. 179-C9.3 HS]|uniref:histidinol-phosphate transaminase n=1 Tax=unclassified Brevibacillus TaxID=2684853 RepID=UPI0039A0E858